MKTTTYSKNYQNKLDLCRELKKDFKSRRSENYQEIIFANGSKVIFNQHNKFKHGIFLFSMVRNDVRRYIADYGQIKPHKTLPVNRTNKDYNHCKCVSDLNCNCTVGIDINNAYWSIAFLKSYISENTYLRGLNGEFDFKAIRLSALSTLGSSKSYQVYEKGVHIKDEVICSSPELRAFYDDIRFTTYGIMEETSKLLQNDFKCWKTDAIYFRNTETNVEIVKSIIEDYGLEWKFE